LGEKGHKLPTGEEARLVSNLLTVICGESHVQPTYSIQNSESRDPSMDKKMQELLEAIAKNTTPKTS
jgi:hypothetical protein